MAGIRVGNRCPHWGTSACRPPPCVAFFLPLSQIWSSSSPRGNDYHPTEFDVLAFDEVVYQVGRCCARRCLLTPRTCVVQSKQSVTI